MEDYLKVQKLSHDDSLGAGAIQDILFKAGITLSTAQTITAFPGLMSEDPDVVFDDVLEYISKQKSATEKSKGRSDSDDQEGSTWEQIKEGFDPKILAGFLVKSAEGFLKSKTSTTTTTSSKEKENATTKLDLGLNVGDFGTMQSAVQFSLEHGDKKLQKIRTNLTRDLGQNFPEDTLTISMVFDIKSDVDPFALGEVSGSIKDIFALGKDKIGYSKVVVKPFRSEGGSGTKFAIAMSFDHNPKTLPLDQIHAFFTTFAVETLNFHIEMSESPDNPIAADQMVQFRSHLKFQFSRVCLDIIDQMHQTVRKFSDADIPDSIDTMVLDLLKRLNNVELDLDLKDLSELVQQLLAEPPTSAMPLHIRNWTTLAECIENGAIKLLKDNQQIPPPLIDLYYSLVDIVQGFDSIKVLLFDKCLRFDFKGISTAFLPNKSAIQPRLSGTSTGSGNHRRGLTNKTVEIVCLGDDQVGKTAFLRASSQPGFTVESGSVSASTSSAYTLDCSTRGGIKLNLQDTISVQNADRADLALLCFAINDKESLENVRAKWRAVCPPTTPAFLIGLKSDLHDSDDEGECVSADEGNACAAQMGALAYFTCSAKDQSGLAAIWSDGIEMFLDRL